MQGKQENYFYAKYKLQLNIDILRAKILKTVSVKIDIYWVRAVGFNPSDLYSSLNIKNSDWDNFTTFTSEQRQVSVQVQVVVNVSGEKKAV